MMAELFGKHDGYCKGRVGSMHIADSDLGILGANAIVAGGIPMAVGAAYSALVRGTDQVAVAFFGEGAIAEGAFHESINLAAVWNLPVIFVCENNLYAEHTHISVHLKTEEISSFAKPYGIQGVSVDGNDVLAVQEAAAQAVARGRSGEGPTLIECKTYRWHGHFEGDPQDYRTGEELEEWKMRDPLKLLRSRLLEEGEAEEEELESLEEEITRMVEEAAESAESSEPPEEMALVEDVYQAPLISDQRSDA
jgi:pyruvate dehydrogenase E1 component alpha subunit